MDECPREIMNIMQTLRWQYIQQLPHRAREMADRWALASRHEHHLPETLKYLHHAAHKLKGSGESFGVPKVTETALRLEQVLEAFFRDATSNGARGVLPMSRERNQISRLIDDLKLVASAAYQDLPTEAHAATDAAFPQPALPANLLDVRHPLILVVDDIDLLRRKVALTLLGEGFRVIEAKDGKEALEQLNEHHPDLVLLDVIMPDMNGFEVQQCIRGQDAFNDVSIIFLTALKEVLLADVQQALQNGVQGYIPKPFSMQSVVQTVTACLLEQARATSAASPSSRNARILVVDDCDWMRQRTALGLRHYGYEVVEAEDGISAINMAQRSRPDLILLDLMMPVMDGFEVQRRLRAISALEDIPIIFLTARDHPEQMEEAIKYGVRGYVTKPTTI